MVIDGFSKYLFATPLKRKTTEATIEGFKKIFRETTRRPDRLQSDAGREYLSTKFQAFMKSKGIVYFTSKNPDTKACLVERVIRTIKSKIFKYLTYKDTLRYIDVLDDIVSSYNNTFHRSISMKPVDVNDTNIVQVYENIRKSQKLTTTRKKKTPKLQVGDYVRITKDKNIFAKGYLPNWTEEVFKIKSIALRDPIVYYLVDLSGEDIEGSFYEPEVQKVLFDEGAAKVIERIIKERYKGKKLQYLVKFRGYPKSFNLWVDADSISSK